MGEGQFWEYPESLSRALGARYYTFCELRPEPNGFDHPLLLWSNEPFDAAVVEREVRNHGWQVVGARTPPPVWIEWEARVEGEPPPGPLRYIGLSRGTSPSGFQVGCWPRTSESLVIYNAAEERWRTVNTNYVLYDRYGGTKSGVVQLTRRQAELLSLADGRPLVTDAEVAALLRAERDARQAFWWRCDRFYAARARRFAAAAAEMRAAAALRADDPPDRQPVDDRDEADRVAAEIPPLPVRLDESFPLLRFLVGHFKDRAGPDKYPGGYQVRCNRLALTVPGEGTLDLALRLGMVPGSVSRGSVTPFLPVEADCSADPAFPDLEPPEDWSFGLGHEAFPVSPAKMTIVGRAGPGTTPAKRVERLGMVLTFPGGLEYITGPEGHGAVYLTDDMRRFDREKGVAVGPEVTLHVPDSIDLIKLVRARLVRHPEVARPRSAP